jgi:hypothetical protein
MENHMIQIPLRPGDVVQIRPGLDELVSGCMVVVTEVCHWGIKGYFANVGEREKIPFRAAWPDMGYVGSLVWPCRRRPAL